MSRHIFFLLVNTWKQLKMQTVEQPPAGENIPVQRKGYLRFKNRLVFIVVNWQGAMAPPCVRPCLAIKIFLDRHISKVC